MTRNTCFTLARTVPKAGPRQIGYRLKEAFRGEYAKADFPEISRVIKANGWKTGLSNIYFVFTPKNVGSCAGSACSYSYFCAYHSQIGSGNTATLYANMPYAAFVPAACGSGQSPNGDDADSTINVTSHEHNEAITDPLGTAWYDRREQENGDKCAWNFAHPLGTTASGSYNQAIGTGRREPRRETRRVKSGVVARRVR